MTTTRHVITISAVFGLFLMSEGMAKADYRGFCSLNGSVSKTCHLEVTQEGFNYKYGLAPSVNVKGADISRLVSATQSGGKMKIPVVLGAQQIEDQTGDKPGVDSLVWSIESQTSDLGMTLMIEYATDKGREELQIRPRTRESLALKMQLESLSGRKFEKQDP